jgi:proline iminopeptidase
MPLYPPIEPHRTGSLDVGDGHRVYFEESGNPHGKPVIFLHGGPGGGTHPVQRRFFDPRRYRIVLFDQRGCGKSSPHASLEANTTWHLVDDIELLRRTLGLGKVQLFGGSWGSTLALAYASRHPENVSELVLRGIFLLRRSELDWFYGGGAANLFPEEYERFIGAIPVAERSDVVGAYYRRLTHADASIRLPAATEWSRWEASTSRLLLDQELVDRCAVPRFSEAFARIEAHFFEHAGFFERDGFLLEQIPKMAHLPCVIVQGRYDVVCPVRSAYDLHRAWPGSELVIVPDAGHAVTEHGTIEALITATRAFVTS